MTPKKEAENLINEYRMILMNEDAECGNEILCTSIAKKCALATVDKIDNIYQKLTPKDDPYNFLLELEYWQEVKKQINKL
jgi:hypothetical protein